MRMARTGRAAGRCSSCRRSAGRPTTAELHACMFRCLRELHQLLPGQGSERWAGCVLLTTNLSSMGVPAACCYETGSLGLQTRPLHLRVLSTTRLDRWNRRRGSAEPSRALLPTACWCKLDQVCSRPGCPAEAHSALHTRSPHRQGQLALCTARTAAAPVPPPRRSTLHAPSPLTHCLQPLFQQR